MFQMPVWYTENLKNYLWQTENRKICFVISRHARCFRRQSGQEKLGSYGKGHATKAERINSDEKNLLRNKSSISKLFWSSFVPDIILQSFS